MTSPRGIKAERLRSISELARMMGKPRRTVLRLLIALHKRHDRRGEWLQRIGARKFLVNLSMLRKEHPALFEVRYVSREEIDELHHRVSDVEEILTDEKKRIAAGLARIRRLESAIKMSQDGTV